MNNLIINGIDHSVFDLEWAKRGGVVMLKKHLAKVTYVCNISGSMHVAQTLGQKVFNGKSFANVSPRLLRMATPAECAEAGVEYIEPPMMWRPIDTLTTDIPTPLFVCDEKSKQIGTLTGKNIFGGACITGWDDHDTKPTHWMSQPQPPKDE